MCACQLSMTVTDTWDGLFKGGEGCLAHESRLVGLIAFEPVVRQCIVVGASDRKRFTSLPGSKGSEAGLGFHILPQGHSSRDLNASNWAPLLKGSTAFQQHHSQNQAFNSRAFEGHSRSTLQPGGADHVRSRCGLGCFFHLLFKNMLL